jgi:hypothetical protein
MAVFDRGGAWYKFDFRGKKGDPPTIGQIKENIHKLKKRASKLTPQEEQSDFRRYSQGKYADVFKNE